VVREEGIIRGEAVGRGPGRVRERGQYRKVSGGEERRCRRMMMGGGPRIWITIDKKGEVVVGEVEGEGAAGRGGEAWSC